MLMPARDYFFRSPSITFFLFFPKSGNTNDTWTQQLPVFGLSSQIS